MLPLPSGVPLLLGSGGYGGTAVQAHDKVGLGAAHADVDVSVVLLDFLVALESSNICQMAWASWSGWSR